MEVVGRQELCVQRVDAMQQNFCGAKKGKMEGTPGMKEPTCFESFCALNLHT